MEIFINTTLLLEQLQVVATPELDLAHCLLEMNEVETEFVNGEKTLNVSAEKALTLCLDSAELEELGHLLLNISATLKRAEVRE